MSGVEWTCVGYTGGSKPWPTYNNIQDHTEAIQIKYNPELISYSQLLEHFFSSHRYSSKSSCQYKSGCWYVSDEQKQLIDKKVLQLKAQGKKVATTIAPLVAFYKAEEYHQKYMAKAGRRY